MKVVSWSLYRMRREARLNGGHSMSLGRSESAASDSDSTAAASRPDRIRMDCLHRYLKAQLVPRSPK
jgi:hypothetical protein